MFGAYFGFWQDIWFLEVASSLPKVVTAKGKFSCSEHILAFGLLEVASSLLKVIAAKGKFSCLEHIFGFGRISGFWQPAR